jgi:hypothetical protein
MTYSITAWSCDWDSCARVGDNRPEVPRCAPIGAPHYPRPPRGVPGSDRGRPGVHSAQRDWTPTGSEVKLVLTNIAEEIWSWESNKMEIMCEMTSVARANRRDAEKKQVTREAAKPCRFYNAGACGKQTDHMVGRDMFVHGCAACFKSTSRWLNHPEVECSRNSPRQEPRDPRQNGGPQRPLNPTAQNFRPPQGV